MKTKTLATLALLWLGVSPPVQAQWIQTNGPFGSSVACLAVSPNGAGGTDLFAGTNGAGVFLSTNNGTSWTAVNRGLTDKVVSVLTVSDTNLFAGTGHYHSGGNGVFLSTDKGISWASVGLANRYVSSLALDGVNIFAGTDSGAFFSANRGTNWTAVDSGMTGFWARFVDALAISGTKLFAGTYVDIYRSTNNGVSWTAADSGYAFAQPGVLAFAVIGTNLFAGGDGNGVFLSTNNGTSWTPTSLTSRIVFALGVSGTNLFAATDSGVWRRPLSDMVTSASEVGGELPATFELKQNFPNPFNPSTTIKYELPNASQVTLTVYDILGRQVSVLVNDRREAGVHEVKFDGSNLASGVYFYRLTAGSYVDTKKLLLVR